MIYLLLKAILTGAVVVAISEISKRSSFLAAILASLPLTSILAFVWMYLDAKDVQGIRDLSYGIFWLVLPSLAFFLILPALLKAGMQFFPSLLISCLCTSAIYWVYTLALHKIGIEV